MIHYLTLQNLAALLSLLVTIATVLGHTLPESRFQRACLAFGINAGRIVAELHGKPDPSASPATVGTSATLESFASAPLILPSDIDGAVTALARLTAAHDALTASALASKDAASNTVIITDAPPVVAAHEAITITEGSKIK